MKASILNPFFYYFYKRVTEIIPKDVKFFASDYAIRDDPYTQFDVSVVVGISGMLTGRAVMAMDTRVALEIAENMSGQPVDSFEEDAQSAVTELMNIIVGNAMSELGFASEQAKFTPPALFYGRAVKTNVSDQSLTLYRQINTDWGKIEFNMSHEEA